MNYNIAFPSEKCYKCKKTGANSILFIENKLKPYKGCTFCDKMLAKAIEKELDLNQVSDYHYDKKTDKMQKHNSEGKILGYAREVVYVCDACDNTNTSKIIFNNVIKN